MQVTATKQITPANPALRPQSLIRH